jgi:hypothetical protein
MMQSVSRGAVMQSDSDEEFNRFCNAPLEERERLRAEREAAHGPELSPITEWPADEEYIPVWGAARLLQIAFSPRLPKPNDSQLGRELIRIVTDRERDNNRQEILRWAREGRIHLIHPTLRIPMPRHPDPGPDWFLDKKTFEHVKNALANGHEPVVLPEPAVIGASASPIDGGAGEAAGVGANALETAADVVTAGGDQPETKADQRAKIEQLGEWIFLQHSQRRTSDELYQAARQDHQIGTFTKGEFLAAYNQKVYITKSRRPPATGWPLRPEYSKRAAEKSSE